MWESPHLEILWACTTCYRDSFAFFILLFPLLWESANRSQCWSLKDEGWGFGRQSPDAQNHLECSTFTYLRSNDFTIGHYVVRFHSPQYPIALSADRSLRSYGHVYFTRKYVLCFVVNVVTKSLRSGL
jgi:hypothetical protein